MVMGDHSAEYLGSFMHVADFVDHEYIVGSTTPNFELDIPKSYNDQFQKWK